MPRETTSQPLTVAVLAALWVSLGRCDVSESLRPVCDNGKVTIIPVTRCGIRVTGVNGYNLCSVILDLCVCVCVCVCVCACACVRMKALFR